MLVLMGNIAAIGETGYVRNGITNRREIEIQE